MAKNGYPSTGSKSPEDRARREAHWRKIVDEWRQSGLTQREFCRRKQHSEPSLGWWIRELNRRDRAGGHGAARSTRAKSGSQAFIPVRLVGAKPAGPASAFEVVVGTRTVRVPAAFEPAALRRLLSALEANS